MPNTLSKGQSKRFKTNSLLSHYILTGGGYQELEQNGQFIFCRPIDWPASAEPESARPDFDACSNSHSRLDNTCALPAERSDPLTFDAKAKRRRWPRIRMCTVFLLLSLLAFILSLAVAMWWTSTRNDISGGFTVGSYVVGVVGLPLGLAGLGHYRVCRCWKTKRRRHSDFQADVVLWTDVADDDRA